MTKRDSLLSRKISSDALAILRQFELFQRFIGPLAQFVVVVDANIILGDLLWLVHKRKTPGAKTELMECIEAGTFVAYITRIVLSEVKEHLPNVARERGISLELMSREWAAYRKLLTVRTPRSALVQRYKDGQDPDDAPTIALAQMIKADGILSKDTDLVAMGGLVIEMDFTKQARDYSRKTAVSATIKLMLFGVPVVIGYGAFNILAQATRGIFITWKKLPLTVKLFILAALVVVASDKRARTVVMGRIRALKHCLDAIAPDMGNILLTLVEEIDENTVPAPSPTFKPHAKA